jgi:effector-binding domain-containing protein
MSLQEMGIKHQRLDGTLVAGCRPVLRARSEVPAILCGLRQCIPAEYIAGPPFGIFQFVTSVEDGFDVEVGYPVSQAVEADGIKTRRLPSVEVLALLHEGPMEKLRDSYRQLYGSAAAHGLISHEFCREVYWDLDDPEDSRIEVQFVLHDWQGLLRENLDRVLGERTRQEVMQGGDRVDIESTVDERFRWVKGAIERIDRLADETKYDIVSGCAHVFPSRQVGKLKVVYEDARAKTSDPLAAVDAVIEFMDTDPGWGERPLRRGNVIYSSKAPRDPQGHANAKSEKEKREAYCFCPLVRSHLDEGMPIAFCYCGAGWYRQQWEGAIGRPVRIEIVQSILKGDDVCQFAIHLPYNTEDRC